MATQSIPMPDWLIALADLRRIGAWGVAGLALTTLAIAIAIHRLAKGSSCPIDGEVLPLNKAGMKILRDVLERSHRTASGKDVFRCRCCKRRRDGRDDRLATVTIDTTPRARPGVHQLRRFEAFLARHVRDCEFVPPEVKARLRHAERRGGQSPVPYEVIREVVCSRSDDFKDDEAAAAAGATALPPGAASAASAVGPAALAGAIASAFGSIKEMVLVRTRAAGDAPSAPAVAAGGVAAPEQVLLSVEDIEDLLELAGTESRIIKEEMAAHHAMIEEKRGAVDILGTMSGLQDSRDAPAEQLLNVKDIEDLLKLADLESRMMGAPALRPISPEI